MSKKQLEIATLGGGCFWCLEAVYGLLDGVDTVTSGASGGHIVNPSYQDICSGSSGHAEVVQIRFDPEVTDYREILNVFFTIHNPTTLNRQGNDVGSQYRSAIFYHSHKQKEAAESKISELIKNEIWEDPIVTEVLPFREFYPAENYHQKYYSKNSQQPYCKLTIDPKIAKLRSKFSHKIRSA